MKQKSDTDRIEKLKVKLCRCGAKAMPGRTKCRKCKER